jgi:hypothetical protein
MIVHLHLEDLEEIVALIIGKTIPDPAELESVKCGA